MAAITDDEIKQLPKIGQCKRCRRTLTDHTSILFEMGPVCRIKEGIDVPKIRVKKAGFTTKKPRIRKVKIGEPEEYSNTNLESWFLGDEEK